MAKSLLGITVALLLGTAVLGYINKTKLDGTRNELASFKEQAVAFENKSKEIESAKDEAEKAKAEAVAKQEQALSDLAKANQDLESAKSAAGQLESQIAEKDSKIKELEDKIASAEPSQEGDSASGVNVAELEAKVKELEGQVSAAEDEKKILTEKVASAQSEADALRTQERKRVGAIMAKGLQGQIEAYNPAYNFVILNIGDRQGAVTNAEMVVTRGGVMVGKVRIASVYPTNAVADIVRSSVPAGVQIQPGDKVIYPGN